MKTRPKLLLILHYSPPIHGASKIGDTILRSNLLKTFFDVRAIKIKSAENIESIGKFAFKKIIDALLLFFKVVSHLLLFRPRNIYFTVSPLGFAFYRDLFISIPIKIFTVFTNSEVFYHYHANGVDSFVSKSILNKKISNFFVSNVNIILISKKIKSEFEKLNSYKRIYYLENGVENHIQSNEFLKISEEREKSKTLNILYLSNMIKTKGYDTVLDLANKLKSENVKNIMFHFAGSWASKEDELYYNNFVYSNNLDDYVCYHGIVNGDRKKEIFIQSRMFIFPTRYPKEVFPLSLLEALSYGLPILAFNKGAISEIIDNETGIISTKDFILESFIKMKNQYINSEASFACRNKFLKNYTIEVFENNLIDILTLKNEHTV